MQNRAHTPPFFNGFFLVFSVACVLTFVFILNLRNQETSTSELELSNESNETYEEVVFNNSTEFNLQDYNIYTFKGYISLAELNDDAYKPLGYEIIKPTLPVPVLRMLKEPTCEETFSEWLRILKEPQPEVPPVHLPIVDADTYLINGYSALTWVYMNNNTKHELKPKNWNRISEFMSFTKSELANLEYQAESESMFHAMSGFPLHGKIGFVVGSMQPWIEVMALQHGAKHVLTVEHYPLDIEVGFEDKLSSILPEDVAMDWKTYAGQFDFAASFSIIQHSGLGRFGEPLDPIGDLREMHKIRCMLKKGGILFFGVPFGIDSVQYNILRVYGSLRLSMMFYGFEWVASYTHTTSEPFDLSSKVLHSRPLFQFTHYTVVLRKL